MDSQNLNLSIDFVGSSGIILSPEQKATLQTSLTLLQSHQKFEQVQFWGKIIGVRDDYYIAQGIGRDYMSDRKSLYSNDCVHWGLLPPANETTKEISRQLTGRFTGDPSFEFEQKLLRYSDEETIEETFSLKEEDRLAAVIEDIDREAMIAPRGAFIKSPSGEVYRNRTFDGLSVSEAGKLYNYLHFNKVGRTIEKPQIQRTKPNMSIDFLDCIEDDIPRGSWSLQFERGSGLVTLRSLLWIGYTFFHIPGTRQYGSVYVGTGEKTVDLPFML